MVLKETGKIEPTAGSTLLYRALAGSVLLWLALPPVGWSLLAWIAPVCWIGWISKPKLPGRRPYRTLWVAGFVFWMLTVHWIRLPHPLNYLAWVALASYLGLYLPLWVALSRVAVWRLRVPLWLVAPVVWTGLELVRAHLLTGFLMGSLAHTQVRWPRIIQLADLVGEYGVTFLIVLVAACITNIVFPHISELSEPGRQSLPAVVGPRSARTLLHLLPAAIALTATLLYGHSRLHQITEETKYKPGPRIALIQGNSLATWKKDLAGRDKIMTEYVQLSLQVAKESVQKDGRAIDLLVWPETMFRQPLVMLDKENGPDPELVGQHRLNAATNEVAGLARMTDSAVLVGIERLNVLAAPPGAPDFPPPYQLYNSSLMVNRQGQVIGTYDKMHRVMFGEYIPFADWLPMLNRITPITGSIQAGQHPAGLELDGTVYSPNICYETVLPHVIRRQVVELVDQGKTPDVLVNLTNDAWYWGSSELDMHLASGVFRAIEMRRPLVVAANGGLSAHVDCAGQVRQVTARQRPAALIVDVELAEIDSLYALWGDWFASVCLLCCVVLAVVGGRRRKA